MRGRYRCRRQERNRASERAAKPRHDFLRDPARDRWARRIPEERSRSRSAVATTAAQRCLLRGRCVPKQTGRKDRRAARFDGTILGQVSESGFLSTFCTIIRRSRETRDRRSRAETAFRGVARARGIGLHAVAFTCQDGAQLHACARPSDRG